MPNNIPFQSGDRKSRKHQPTALEARGGRPARINAGDPSIFSHCTLWEHGASTPSTAHAEPRILRFIQEDEDRGACSIQKPPVELKCN